ncbi:adenylate isopentenyltransferase-like [Quercus lobata]|uniref:Adenylate isopentenyltransferase n=1 Tax=Quercus lobata TaxID=97700 RepID=A0A7N2KQ84_QUELO|nr:adenylate isopentenyltransferase-like [Quercus lobata]
MRIEMRLVQYSYSSSTQAQYSSYSHFSFFSSSKPKLFFKIPRWPRMDSTPHHRKTNHNHNHNNNNKKKDKIVVIMGATGTGKSKLSIDLATRFHAEIINSDKMQVYNGLDITTNKIPLHQRCGITHHLLGEVDPVLHDDFSPLDFRNMAGSVISDIVSRRKLPLIVGGSNSFVHALLVDRFDPVGDSNVFDPSSRSFPSSTLRYNCCFLWVDVSMRVLSEYLSLRVEDMFDSGMLDELTEFFSEFPSRSGLKKAIGIPEFENYFKKYPPHDGGDPVRTEEAYMDAVREIKDNTCQLAKRQIGKIVRLKGAGWDLRRLDATEAFREVMSNSNVSGSEIWERQVLEPSVKIVKRFLEE